MLLAEHPSLWPRDGCPCIDSTAHAVRLPVAVGDSQSMIGMAIGMAVDRMNPRRETAGSGRFEVGLKSLLLSNSFIVIQIPQSV